jgi:hypothetical protein
LKLEQCRKKLEREAKQATVEIFGGKFWSADFCDWQGELPRRSELRESCRGGPSGGKRMMKRGGSGRSRGFFIFLEIGRGGGEAVQIMVDEHRDAQIDNRRDL